ncbi:MAG: hypothetical protein ABI887_00590 [Burkholderiales bacterium]
MDRMLTLRLESVGCTAEALLNGVPLARTPRGGGLVSLPVHEYTLTGDNDLELVIEPPPLVPGFERLPPESRLSDGEASASLSLLLPRVGNPANGSEARTLAQLNWVSPPVEILELPLVLASTVNLPVNFPRWRWLDAPPIDNPDAIRPQIAGFLQGIALALARGDAEGLISAARLRFDELAQAYQREPRDDLARFRAHIQQAHAEGPLRPMLPTAQGLLLRRCAGGRLLECLTADGSPALNAERPNGARMHWPVRLAMVEERLYVLR